MVDFQVMSLPKYVFPLVMVCLYLNLVCDALGLGRVASWNEVIVGFAILDNQICALLLTLFAQQLLFTSLLTRIMDPLIWHSCHHMSLWQIGGHVSHW